MTDDNNVEQNEMEEIKNYIQALEESVNVLDFKLDPTKKSNWVAALRSGDYDQCTGTLCDGDSYCCLGVYLEVNEKLEKRTDLEMYGVRYIDSDGGEYEEYMPYRIIPEPIQKALSEINDETTLQFLEIADLIEELL